MDNFNSLRTHQTIYKSLLTIFIGDKKQKNGKLSKNNTHNCCSSSRCLADWLYSLSSIKARQHSKHKWSVRSKSSSRLSKPLFHNRNIRKRCSRGKRQECRNFRCCCHFFN